MWNGTSIQWNIVQQMKMEVLKDAFMDETWKYQVKTFSRKRPHTGRLHLHEIPRTDRFTKRESTLLVPRDGGRAGGGGRMGGGL